LAERAEAGDVDAQTELAGRFATGDGMPVNLGAALIWYGRASDHGNSDASFNLALMYLRGEGCKRNRRLATKFLRLAEVQGSSDASIALAEMCINVATDDSGGSHRQALNHLIRATLRGDSRGALMITLLLGKNQMELRHIAEEFLRVSASAGNREAQSLLATRYDG
jgi:TPR repeat protein